LPYVSSLTGPRGASAISTLRSPPAALAVFTLPPSAFTASLIQRPLV